MIHVPRALTPPVNRRRGLVWSSNGSVHQARSMAIPVQPTSNVRTLGTIAVSAAASLWNSLSPSNQALWGADNPIGNSGYSFFSATNALLHQWGLSMFASPPAPSPVSGITTMAVYGEPDGIHMTLGAIAAGVNLPGIETWARVYAGATTLQFLGSFGPLVNSAVSYFDITDAWMAIFGQWYPLQGIDTTTHIHCGVTAGRGGYYTSDQYGRPCQIGPNYLQFDAWQFFPGPIGPAACPLPNSPPYPWPPSH